MYHITIQQAADNVFVPAASLLRKWAKQALREQLPRAEVTIRVVNVDEMTELNTTYRHKKGPTNVLSFPFDMPEGMMEKQPILGDIIICAEVVNREAREQNKAPQAHWAHMIVHGIFHLLRYDHETEAEAEVMEALEIKTLRILGFEDPYHESI
ncbi:MAG: rRNA maturation RNase YbeY [Gammaproteobacteria bacterium]|nr:MAG: rRNA maturation RNase YbeY [Gammaproteobacteria bacterium]